MPVFFSLAWCQTGASVQTTSERQSPGLISSLSFRRQLAAASVTNNEDSCKYASFKYFALCGLGGIISCGSTHTSVVPLDLLKCRMQVDPIKYKSVYQAFKITVAEEGYRGLFKGWAPTFLGYSAQGMCKFGLYEVFKYWYSNLVGDERAFLHRTWLYLFSAASAEFFADILLSPMEAAKVKIQTTPGFANTLREALPKMIQEDGVHGFYKSIVPLWGRQIPYTMAKFTVFERTLEAFYKYLVPIPREKCSKAQQLLVTFGAGYVAGVFCAVISQPADTLVSKLNQEKGSTTMDVLKKLGFIGVWKGLLPRIVMIGTLTALQWFVYDGFKVAMRMPRPPPADMPESLRKKLAAQQKRS